MENRKIPGSDAHHHGTGAPSPWVERFAPLVPDGGAVLDVACGGGRHARLFLDKRHAVTALDKDTSGVDDLSDHAEAEIVKADLEDGSLWPLAGRTFAAVVVTNYLHRPLLATLRDSVDAGGVLIYETFAHGNERYRRPRNPDHLLRPGELLELVRGTFAVVAYEYGLVAGDETPAVIERICAVNGGPESAGAEPEPSPLNSP